MDLINYYLHIMSAYGKIFKRILRISVPLVDIMTKNGRLVRKGEGYGFKFS